LLRVWSGHSMVRIGVRHRAPCIKCQQIEFDHRIDLITVQQPKYDRV
jgi:hypothetical protein